MADVTADEKKLVDQLRARVADIVQPSHDDYYLVRWLRARRHNLDKAEAMYRKSMAWRKEFGADTILDTYTPPEVLSKHYVGGVTGEDKYGRPVSIDPIGKLDLKGLLYSLKKAEIIRYVVWQCEKVGLCYKKQSIKHGKRISQSTQVLDFDGFGKQHFWKPGIDMFTEMLVTVEDNYPETLHSTYFVNAPYLFTMCWALVSPFVSEDTRKKFIFLKGDWCKQLTDMIVPDEVPVNWGGSLMGPDNDPYCKHLVQMGGKVPEKYYQSKDNFFPKGADVKKESVSAGSTLRLNYTVGPKEKAIRYFFHTDHGDIMFGIFRKPDGSGGKAVPESECEEVEAMATYSCCKVPEDGLSMCKPGDYTLVFSNKSSYSSFIWSNKITYFIEVVKEDSPYDEDSNGNGEEIISL